MSSGIAVQHTTLNSLVDLAEGGVPAGLNRCLGFVSWGGDVGIAGTETALHQRSHSGLVSLVLETVALSDLDALL